ncbi:hypothetical protein ACQP0U_21945 [Micromonospora sp. CA-269861]|uniref:AbiJ-related protein n=1 Tax=Micromonospora sp. CA-269861 TaxID=3239968 RepID=UPI003D8D2091
MDPGQGVGEAGLPLGLPPPGARRPESRPRRAEGESGRARRHSSSDRHSPEGHVERHLRLPRYPSEVSITAAGNITDVTRRRLTEGLARLQVHWSGVLEEVDLLGRLYDVDALPSRDPRFHTAGQDIEPGAVSG